jgi:membrane glycosyltransferase
MIFRRCVLVVNAALALAGLGLLLARALAPDGWTPLTIAIFACFLGTMPWLGLGPGNGLIGFAWLIAARDPARSVLPVDGDIETAPITALTALAVTVRDEDMALVMPPLRRLLDGLDADGAGRHFALFFLSDTSDGTHAAAEAAAIATFARADRDPDRVRYRRRSDNAGFKAGNVMDFLDHDADGFEFAVMLDADSQMSAGAVLRLVRIMQAAPRMGIVQHLTVGLPAAGAFPRLFQFGMRVGMRTWAVGQAWWQGDAGPYWGHNAILRIAPFRAHCRLPKLPDGRDILSHDQVEAALLRGAGWGVCVLAREDGSAEANPPTLIDFLRRDERWMMGNMQYRHLLGMRGLRPMGRWQLVQAMLLFSGGPLYTIMLTLAAIHAALGGGGDVARASMLALVLGWLALIYAPKWLGYGELLISREKRARYGGAARLFAGIVVETMFTLLLDAVQMPHKALALARHALGRTTRWLPQNRRERGVTWAEAARTFWLHTLFGLVIFALLARGSGGAVLWALPFAGGLPLAIPFCVLTSAPAFSAWLRRQRVAAIPEEFEHATSGAGNIAVIDAIRPAPHSAG